jgi:hypothetical protein
MSNGVFWDVMPCGSVRTDVSEELSPSIIRVTRIGELGTTIAVTINVGSYRATRRNIPEDAVLHSNRRKTSDLTWSEHVYLNIAICIHDN